jgi:hypothetical protein
MFRAQSASLPLILKQSLTSRVRAEDPTKASFKTIVRWRWKRYFNHYLATVGWHLGSRVVANAESARVVDALRENGIAITDVRRLGLSGDLVDELMQQCSALADSPDARRIGEDRHDNISGVKKSFFFRLLGHDTLKVEKPDVFSRIALDPTIMGIANSYLRCYSRLTRYNVWLNLPSSGDPVTSQLWHRDYGDTVMLKMFILACPVTQENGAFSYVPGSHQGGRRENLDPPVILELGNRRRTLDKQMSQVVPESEWVTAAGEPGTVIFADTSGFHKGGHVRNGRRLLFKSYYTRWVCIVGTAVDVVNLGELSNVPAAHWATGRRPLLRLSSRK